MNREQFYKQLLGTVTGTYVEVGTCWGGFAEFLLLNTPVKKLYCVDPYKVFPVEEYFDSLNFQSQNDLNQKFDIVCNRLIHNKLNKPVFMARMTSEVAAGKIEDDLAFVYIDGNHHYKEVMKDLTCWWKKIKRGGLLCGDDVEDITKPHDAEKNLLIQHNPQVVGKYGVATALRDFAQMNPDFKYTVVGNQFYAVK